MQRLAKWLRMLAEWLSPLNTEWDDQIVATVIELAKKANLFAEGTSGEFKRQWVLHRLKKAFPSIRTSRLALHVEYVIFTGADK